MSDKLFHIIDGAVCIVHSRGVYRQVDVYRRGEDLFARHGSGFNGPLWSGGAS